MPNLGLLLKYNYMSFDRCTLWDLIKYVIRFYINCRKSIFEFSADEQIATDFKKHSGLFIYERKSKPICVLQNYVQYFCNRFLFQVCSLLRFRDFAQNLYICMLFTYIICTFIINKMYKYAYIY